MEEQLARPWQSIHDALNVQELPFDGLTLAQHVANNAMSMPDATALVIGPAKISYAQLEAAAGKLANALHAAGIGADDVVGVKMPNLPQYAVILLATMKLGARMSSVSPLLAPPEMTYQIQDAGISVLFIFDAFVPKLLAEQTALAPLLKLAVVTGASDFFAPANPELPADLSIKTASYSDFVADANTAFEQREVDTDAVFLLQYTGGTTGKPKGAMLSIHNLMHVIEHGYVYRPYRLGQERVVCAFPFFHIAGISALIAALRNGASFLLVPDPRDIDYLCEQMLASPPTIIGAVPTLYQMIVNHPKSREIDFSELRLAITGAAPITGGDRNKLEAMIGQGVLSDAFGMTETSPTYVVNPPTRCKPEAVGIPLPGTDVRIVDLDTGTQEQAYGVEGEIIASGPGVMQGYLNLPAETDKALREFHGRRYMYSGDVGYMDEDGYIYVCDRAKDMLIVGGYKVFSVEVEDKLANLDYIVQCAVVATPDEKRPGNDIVNLFVQLAENYQQQERDQVITEITEYCRANMAPYKVPKRFHFVDAIPVTAVGKIDKKLMRDMAINA